MSKNIFKYSLIPAVIISFLLAGCGEEKPEVLVAAAKESLAKQDPKKAIIQIKNALQGNPDMPEARFLLGDSLFTTGNPAAAEIELEKARALHYSDDLVIPVLAKAWLAQAKFKKLTDEFAATKLSSPAANLSLQISLSNAFAVQGNSSASESALNSALAIDPESTDALIVKIRRLAEKGELPKALELADAVLLKNPKNAELLKLKGDIVLYSQKNIDAALVEYRKSVAIKPDFLPAHVAILSLLLQQDKLEDAGKELEVLKGYAANSPQNKYFETQLAYQKKDLKQARELAQQLLRMVPDNARALQLAGVIEYQLGSFLQTEVYLTKALTAQPTLSLARRTLTLGYLRSGQPTKALVVLSPALSQEPVDPSLFSIAGEVYLQTGDVAKASDYFARASKLDPQDTRKKTALALAHVMGSNPEAGFSELRDIAESDKGTSADLALISAYLRKQDFDKALKAIDRFEKKQPQNPLSWNLKGGVQLSQKNIEGARKSFETALTLNPLYFPAVANLASLDLNEKKPEEARKRFETVLSKDPKNGPALLGLARLRLQTGGSKEDVAALITKAVEANPTDPASHILLVDYHIQNRDYKLAATAAQNALTAIPDNPDVMDALGRSQQVAGDTNQAISTYNKLATLQPSSFQPLLRLADVNFTAKDEEAAAQSLKKALEIKPDLLEAQRGLILMDIKAQRYQSATSTARNIQRQRPKEAIGYLLEADVNIAEKKWPEAIDIYRNALKQTTSSVPAAKLHAALVQSGNKAEADKYQASWMKDHPKDINFIGYLGDAALSEKDYPNAEKYYLSLIQIQPNSAVVYNNLAWLAGQAKKSTALGYAEKANALLPNEPAFMDTLAMLLADKNDYAKALEWQNKAVGLQPDNLVLRLNLAKIYIKAGDKSKAKSVLETLSKTETKFAGQEEVPQLLKSL